MSSAHGPLAHLLYCFPERAAQQPTYRAVYADLFARLPAATRLTILCAPAARDDLDALLASSCPKRGVAVVCAPEGLRFSVWVQDPFVVVREGDETRLLTPAVFRRESDAEIAGVLDAAGVARACPSTLHFHGAHILVGDDFALVGRDCLDVTGGPPEAFEEAFGVRVVFVGTDLPVPAEERREVDGRVHVLHEGAGAAQPLGHLDMFVSLAGRNGSGAYRVLVGSPSLADEILGRAPVEHSVAEIFDDVAASLARAGFDVVRNPVPLTHADGRRTVEGIWRDVRRWYWASANNSLVQIDAGAGNAVWMPTYGHGAWRELAATDEANREIWAGLGFEVHELGDCHGLAQSGGSVHCITKELERYL